LEAALALFRTLPRAHLKLVKFIDRSLRNSAEPDWPIWLFPMGESTGIVFYNPLFNDTRFGDLFPGIEGSPADRFKQVLAIQIGQIVITDRSRREARELAPLFEPDGSDRHEKQTKGLRGTLVARWSQINEWGVMNLFPMSDTTDSLLAEQNFIFHTLGEWGYSIQEGLVMRGISGDMKENMVRRWKSLPDHWYRTKSSFVTEYAARTSHGPAGALAATYGYYATHLGEFSDRAKKDEVLNTQMLFITENFGFSPVAQ
ncbi:MAG: hypothetical protein Q7S00_08285, partial [bacterium]|nr:hypothetical protein [bacterium]